MKKKLVALSLAVVMCFGLTACGGGSSSETSAPADTTEAAETEEQTAEAAETEAVKDTDEDAAKSSSGSYTIAVSLNDTDEYRTSWLDNFTEAAEAKGHKVISANASSDASKQISDVESLIAQQPDIIVLHAFSQDGAVPAVEAIDAAGIPCVLFDFPVDSDLYTTFVTDEQALNGEIQANYVNDWLAEDSSRVANVGYIVGSYSMQAAMPRRDKFYEVLGITEAMAEQEGGWSADDAMKITEDWLQAYPDMNVFACMNDDMAIGVIQALSAAGKDMDEVLVLGIDGTDAAKEYLRTGELDCTAARDVKVETGFTLETCEKILAGESVEKNLQPEAIYAMTSENVD